jgi:hypothetical protein
MWIHRGCLCLCAGLLAGCEKPHPSITEVSPNQAYSGQDVSLAILGDDFVPATILDPDHGRRIVLSDGFAVRIGRGNDWWQLADVTWLAPSQLSGWFSGNLTEGIPPGSYDVEMLDPRGEKTVLPDGFTHLGQDRTPPQVVIDSPAPDTIFTPGMFLRGHFQAWDVFPGKLSALDWSYQENGKQIAGADGSCVVVPKSAVGSCNFQVRISDTLREGSTVTVIALAADAADPPNVAASVPLSFTLRALPTVTALTPSIGGTQGGTDVVITGSGFVPGSSATVDGVPLFPNGGIVVNGTTMSGHVPSHPAGSAAVVVHTPIGDSKGTAVFTYKAPPQITAVSVALGTGTCRVLATITGTGFGAETRIYWGSTLASAVALGSPTPQAPQSLLQSDGTILGCMPAAGTAPTVWAVDPDLGYTQFSWRSP